MKKTATCIMMALISLFLVGCSLSHRQIKIEKTDIVTTGIGVKSKADFNMDYYQGAMVFLTQGIVSGNVTVIKTKESPMEVGEFYPGKLKTQGIVIDGDKEYFVQSVICDVEEKEDLFDYANLIEAQNLSDKARIYRVSAAAEIGFDAEGNDFSVDIVQFKKDKAYRRKLGEQKGSLVSDCQKLFGWSDILETWNLFSTENGLAVSPLTLEQIKFLASINSADTFLRKLVACGKFEVIPLDKTATLIGLFIDCLKASQYPDMGPNFGSNVPDRKRLGDIAKVRFNVIKKFREMKERIGGEENEKN